MSTPKASLAELADLARAPMSRSADRTPTSFTALAGDVVLETTATRPTARLASDGEEVQGRQTIVIRPHADSDVLAEWLLLWLQSDEFAALAEQYSTGSTVRSLALKDLRNFEVPVPSVEEQRRVRERLEPISQALEAQRDLVSTLEAIQSVERRRLYLQHARGVPRG